ncbi:MAG: PAS domain S-box protein [Candidatus Doudnabacteria bacterium]|nr:PAS domain S-box protein [Candidatus Doudnabacteria bacterium]
MSATFSLFNFIFVLGIFTVVVVTIFLFEYRRLRKNLMVREQEMTRRMYQLSILRELGERIGYSLKIDQIVEVISGSLRRLLDYSTVSYMLISTTAEGRTKIAFNINLEKPVHKKFIEAVKLIMLDSLNTLMSSNFASQDVEETVSGTVTDPTSQENVGSFFNVPVAIGGSVVGVLNIASTERGLYRGKEVEILYTIMNQASDAVSKLEQVLKIEKGKLNSMVASMADGVLMIDKQKQLIVVNPAAKLMLGIEKPSLNIFDVLEVVSEQFDFRTKLEESINSDKLVVVPSVNLGNHVSQVLISPVKDESNNLLGSVIIFHDITREKELEKMREDFTNMMVHELRSPLTGIRSIASLLLNDKVKSDQNKYAEFVGLISSNSQDMLGLVNDLLDVAKLESGKFQILKKQSDIHALIEQRIASFRSLAEQGNLTLTQKLSSQLPAMVELDEHKISQVLNNFISNAIKFTRTGGSIVVSAFLLPAGKDLAQQIVEQQLIWPGIKRGASFPKPQLVIAVTDSGLGISGDKISKLFNKFVQLENVATSEKKGTGLGLVICKGIIEAHKGSIGVYSEEGEGSTFYITLPVS